MRLGRKSFFAAVLLVAAALVGGASGQTTSSGALSGVVIDKTNAVVPDAAVKITDLAKGTTDSTKTNGEGVYQFSFLRPGTYSLSVTRPGFQEARRSTTVQVGPPVTVNVTLQIATASSEIIVTEKAPIIHAETADVSSTMNQKQISEIPNPGNDLTYIVQTTPGVWMNTDVPNATGMNFSILGMPSTSYLYSIDGVDNPPTGVLGLLLGQNQVQEATVVSTGYSGQFGNAAGGNINYVTKSGSNEVHGNAQYYWNGRVFNANDWFNKALGNPRPFDIANQWAGSFGGPIRKDKLFFFFDTEGLRVLIPTVAQTLIPSPQFEAATIANIDFRFGAASASDAFYKQLFNLYNAAPGASSAASGSFVPGDLGCIALPIALGAGVPCVMHFLSSRAIPSQDALTATRVDWNLNRSGRIFLRLQRDASHTTFFASPLTPIFDNRSKQTWWQGQAIETHTFGASAANQFLFAYSHIDSVFGVDDRAKAVAAFPTHIFFPPPEQFAEPGNGFQFRSNVVQYQISEDFVKAGRNHKFGLGANFDRWSGSGFVSPDLGFLIPLTLDAFYQGGADPNSPKTDFTQLYQSFQSSQFYPEANYHLGVYAQDEWHARPGLTLTIALRAEHQSNTICKTRCFARLAGPFNAVSHDPNQPYHKAILVGHKPAFQGLDNILWSPRCSFGWQPLR